MPYPAKGAANYLLIAVLAFGAGAGGAWLLQRPSYRLDPVTTHGEYLWVPKDGDSVWTYIAFPERSDKAPAVVVIHEIFGLTDWEPTVADQLASRGYVAIAPDLLSSRFGPTTSLGDSVRQKMGMLTPDGVNSDLDAIYDYVNNLPAVRQGQIGAIGFCWGGGTSFRYATVNPRLKAAVVCYGPNPPLEALAAIQSPVLGVYGENDARINASLPSVVTEMQRLGKSFQADSYPGTGHGFLKPGRRGYDTEQPRIAWERIETFFKQHLGN